MCLLRKPTKIKKTPCKLINDLHGVFNFLWFSPLYTIFSAIYNLQYKQRINLMCIHCHFVPVSAEGISVHVLFIGKHTNGIRCAALLQRKIIHKYCGCNPLFRYIRSRLWSHPSQPDSRRLPAALRNPALRRHFWRTGK